MLGKLATAGLCIVGIWLIALGVQRWLDHRDATQVVHRFAAALQRGDRPALLALFSPERQAQMESRFSEVRGTAPVEFTYRIHHVQLDGREASAQLWIESNGFVMQPTMTLVRPPDGGWRIDRIDRLNIDPRWRDFEEKRMQAAGEALAKELRNALSGAPGVIVERVELEGVPE